MNIVVCVALLFTAVTAAQAEECDLSGSQVSDCDLTIRHMVEISHDMEMTHVKVTCPGVPEDSCIVLSSNTNLKIASSTLTGAHQGRFLSMGGGSSLEMVDTTATSFGRTGSDAGFVIAEEGAVTATFENVEASDCVSEDGGVIRVMDGSTLSLTGCTFKDNWAQLRGGAVSVWESSATISNCHFEGNIGFYGGGIDSYDSNVDVEGCSFVSNTVDDAGGAICVMRESGKMTITGSTFESNEGTFGSILACRSSEDASTQIEVTIAADTEIPDSNINNENCKITQL